MQRATGKHASPPPRRSDRSANNEAVSEYAITSPLQAPSAARSRGSEAARRASSAQAHAPHRSCPSRSGVRPARPQGSRRDRERSRWAEVSPGRELALRVYSHYWARWRMRHAVHATERVRSAGAPESVRVIAVVDVSVEDRRHARGNIILKHRSLLVGPSAAGIVERRWVGESPMPRLTYRLK